MLRAEAAGLRASAFALLSAEYAGKVAAVKARYSGRELAAALNAIRDHHLAAERALSLKLNQQDRTRRRVVLDALRERRNTHGKNFRAAAHTHARKSKSLAQRHSKERRQLRTRRRHTAKPKR